MRFAVTCSVACSVRCAVRCSVRIAWRRAASARFSSTSRLHHPVRRPPHGRLQREPSRAPPAGPHRRPHGLRPALRYDEKADGQPRRDPLGQPVDDMGQPRGVRGERGGVRAEEGPDAVLDDRQPQRDDEVAQFAPPPLAHGRGRRVVERRLKVEGGERSGPVDGAEGVRPYSLRITRERDENHPQPSGDLLDQRIRQLLHADPAARPDQGGEGGGDGLPGVAGEQQLGGVRPPAGHGEQPGGALAGGRGPVGGARTHGLRQHVGPQQRREGGRDELRLPCGRRVVEFEVDGRGGGRLDERPPLRDGRRGPHEGPSPRLSHHQATPHEFAVDPSGRGGRDAVPHGRTTFAGAVVGRGRAVR